MKLENVLKVMAAVTAMLVACSEVLNQAVSYQKMKKDIDLNITKEGQKPTSSATND